MAVCLVCLSCGGKSAMTSISGYAQGTFYSVKYYDDEGRDLKESIDSLLRVFDLSASLWVEDSRLNKLNRGEDSLLDAVTADLLEKSLQVCDYTGGAFDCRVGKLVNAWGFGAKDGVSPEPACVDSLLDICHAAVELHRHADGTAALWRADRRTEIDFNAIAQGYSVDVLAAFLDEKGIHNYIIDIGGEVIAKGRKKGGTPWVVGIEKPADDRYDRPQVMEAVALENAALVTSGSYRKYYEKDGVRYSHTIDPSTGYPVDHTLLSVTVVDSTAWRADALATAFMVMGLDSALRFVDRHDVSLPLFFIYDNKGCLETRATPSMQKMLDRK